MTTCFLTVYDDRAEEMTLGMINSVKKWYPEIPMEALVINKRDAAGGFDLQGYCHDVLQHGLNMLDKYDRIIHIDPDSIMCNKCPDLFDDFDLGCVLNNTVCGPEYGGTKGDDYINAGLSVCTNKKVWQKIMDEFHRNIYEGHYSWKATPHKTLKAGFY